MVFCRSRFADKVGYVHAKCEKNTDKGQVCISIRHQGLAPERHDVNGQEYIDNKKTNEIYFLQNIVYLGGEIRITRQSY